MMPYCLHVALLLTACWLFYKLLLQNETYYHLNRVLLLACIAASFLLPLVPVPHQYSMRSVPADVVAINQDNISQKTIEAGTTSVAAENQVAHAGQADADAKAGVLSVINMRGMVQWAFWLYWCGVLALGANFLLQLGVLFYQAYRKPVIRDGKYRIVELDGDKAPCSFGNNIFINPAKYDWETYNQILMHEKVHIQQGHTIDLIVAELMLILQWFNPFAWLYRKEMESNMEFLTDNAMLETYKVGAEDYQMSLLKVSVPNYSMRVTTNYNQSLLKRRIMMMKTKRSNIHSMWKYAMLMPFMTVMLCGFNQPVDTSIKPLVTAAKKVGTKLSAAVLPDTTKKQLAKVAPPQKGGTKKAGVLKVSDGKVLNSQQLLELTEQGISADYIKSFTDIGYKDMSPATIQMFDDANISAEYVKSFMDIGYNITPANILAFDDAGIGADYVKSFMDIKFPNLTVATILAFDDAGISADYVKGLQKAGFKDLTEASILAFDEEGIGADFVKGMVNSGLKDPSAATVLAFDNQGISPDYVKAMMGLGIEGLTSASILAFDNQGISPDYVKAMMGLGIAGLTSASILAFDDQGVGVEYVKGLMNTGLKKITPSVILAFDEQGVSVEYIKGILAAGLKNVTAADILAFDEAGVSPDYIKSFTKLGLTDLTPAVIINNDKKGVTAQDVKAGVKKP